MNEKELEDTIKEAEKKKNKLRLFVGATALVFLLLAVTASVGIYKVKTAEKLHNGAVNVCGIDDNNYNQFDKRCCYDSYIENEQPGKVENGKCYYSDGIENTKVKFEVWKCRK